MTDLFFYVERCAQSAIASLPKNHWYPHSTSFSHHTLRDPTESPTIQVNIKVTAATQSPAPALRHCIVHLIEKKPDGTPAVLHARDSKLGDSQAMENLLADLNESYNAKQGKAWSLFL